MVSCDNIISNMSSCWFTEHLAHWASRFSSWWKMSFAELHQSHEAVCRGTSLESPQPSSRPLWNSSEVCGFSVVTPGRRCRSRVDFPWEQKRESWCCLAIAVDFRQQWTSLSDKKNSGSWVEMISRKKSLDTLRYKVEIRLYFTLHFKSNVTVRIKCQHIICYFKTKVYIKVCQIVVPYLLQMLVITVMCQQPFTEQTLSLYF